MYGCRFASRRVARGALLAVSLLLSVLLAYSSNAQYDITYVTSTGTKPEVQALRTVDGQTSTLDGSWKIYVDTGSNEYATIAGIVKSGIYATTGYDLTISDLSSRNDAYDQIVIGEVSSDSIDALAARHQRNTTDLGDEGYNLISLPNSGKWLVLIAANKPPGARHGAYTLLDLVETGSGKLQNIRIRDYPDSPHREVQHWLPTVPKNTTGANLWLQNRETELDTIAAWGANVVAFGRGDFFRMGDTPQGLSNPYGYWLKQLTDYATSRGVAPGVDIARPPSGHWKEREGWYVDLEPFVIDSTLSLSPLYEFHNEDFNMSFDSLNVSGWPTGWARPDTTDPDWGDPRGYDIVYGEGDDVHIRLEQTTGKRARLLQVLYRPPGLPNPGLQGFSLYVLTVRFTEVDWADHPQGKDNPNLAVRVIGNLKSACPKVEVLPSPPYGEIGDNVIDLTAWSESFFSTFNVRKTDSLPRTDDFYFWTPPTKEQADALGLTAAGFTCPYFDSLSYIAIQIETVAPEDNVANVVMEIEDLYLERRESALRNVMQWWGGDLRFDITDKTRSTIYLEDQEYDFNYRPPATNFDYWMETFPAGREHPDTNRSVVTWLDTTRAGVGDTVYVSCNVGVPKDWDGAGGQATTYCLKSPELLDWHRDNIEEWFLGDYAFDPKFVTLRLDERRGMNRCERGRYSSESNADYLANYVVEIESMLDDIGADSTTLIVYAGTTMQPLGTESVKPGYQLQWGGKYGSTVARSWQFGQLASMNRKTIFPVGFEYADKVRVQEEWPSAESPGPNVGIVGWMIYGQPDTHYQYGATGARSTWYESDAAGFLAASEFYSDTLQTEEELRLLDYAWKRHRHPDVTLHARKDGAYITDDVVNRIVAARPMQLLAFEPYGTSEERDSSFSVTMEWDSISVATIDWGDGSAPDTVATITTNQLNRGVFSHSWTDEGLYDVTLRAEAGDSVNTATIHVDIGPDTTIWSGNVTLEEDYVVLEGRVLIMDAGTTVTVGPDTLDGSVRIWVDGTLVIDGTEQNPVDIAYVDTLVTDGWVGIFVRETGNAVIDHCRYRNAAGGIGVRGRLNIYNTTIEDCEGIGLSVAAGDSSYASNVTIRDIEGPNPIGVNLLQDARLQMDDCTVEGAYWGGLVYGNGNMYLENTSFHDNTFGVFVFQDGTLSGVGGSLDSYSVGLRAYDRAKVSLVGGCAIDDNYKGVELLGADVTATIDSCTFSNNDIGAYLWRSPQGTITGCTFTGSDDEAIHCAGDSAVTIALTIDGNIIRQGGTGIACYGSDPGITNNLIEDNTGGIHCDNSSPTLTRNRILDNTSGITAVSGSEPVLDHCGGACADSCADPYANTIKGGSGYRFSNLDPNVTIDAECTYWGCFKQICNVPSSWFYGLVDYQPYLSQEPDPPAVAAQEESGRQLLPRVYGLSLNYPNPFNPSTTIAYQVPAPGGAVSIRVYNVRGQLVTTLVSRTVAPGFHTVEWEGVDSRGTGVASGVYFVHMLAPGFKQTRKVVVLK